MEEMKPGKGWAWAISDIHGNLTLCHYSEPSKAELKNRYGSESAINYVQAKPVFVAIVPMKSYRKLLKAK